MSDSPNLTLPYLQPAQAQKHVTHNHALERLDALVQLSVEAFDVTDPPDVPVDGEVWGIGPGAVDTWGGRGGQLAYFTNGAWLYLEPREGMRAWNKAENALWVRRQGAWRPIQSGDPANPNNLNNLEGLGVNTTYNADNRISVAAPATLLNHEGAGHQLKINKAAASDTASLLYQTGFSGRAEMGLAGNDDFAVKVSADGTSWTTALSIEASTGNVAMDNASISSLTGDAVQQSADDATPGRLMRADYGYGPGNILGPVSEVGGTPAGAVIERGENANGDYVRFADGTQICSVLRTLVYAGAPYLSESWVFAAPFAPDCVPAIGLLPNATTWASGVGSTPTIGDITVAQGNSSNTFTVLQAWRRSGAGNFDAGDTAQIYATAIGRWF